ncbi:MAG: hypothetical protein QNL12_00715 [Acidimicrobiia bacterium]|nr:hypothetical protein [Acidimicrobiia bacterium]MDX2465808.1 hypothetical protein [Acidimicrobiia bacterium]
MRVPYRVLVVATLALAASACSGGVFGPPTTTQPPPSQTTSTAVAPTTPPLLPPSPQAGLCRSYDDPAVLGTVANTDITETSGIALSRVHPGIVWMHNDSGGGAVVYATTLEGVDMGTFDIDVAAFDWEDMAIGAGPDPELDYLYLGDIGDNLHFRPVITVYRIAEPIPTPTGGFVADAASFNLAYPEPGPDAESMLVDPVTGDILIITKPSSGDPAQIFRAPADQLSDGATTNLIAVGSFRLERGTFVTAADIDRSGSVVVFRGYNEVWLWERTDIDFSETFSAEPCRTPSTAEVQGEAISFVGDGYSYVTVSEGTNPDINLVSSIFD